MCFHQICNKNSLETTINRPGRWMADNAALVIVHIVVMVNLHLQLNKNVVYFTKYQHKQYLQGDLKKKLTQLWRFIFGNEYIKQRNYLLYLKDHDCFCY